jgi:NH3-dependent NAD+ synthetase
LTKADHDDFVSERLKRTKATGNWVNIAGVVDSGAVASVAPESVADWIPKRRTMLQERESIT